MLSRRTALGLGAGLALSPTAVGAPLCAEAQILPLWPGNATPTFTIEEKSSDPSAYHSRWLTAIAAPFLLAFQPARPDGSAMLAIPGGGYGFLSVDNEGIEVARRLVRSGITVFVLLHRLPREASADAPLADAQRALRLIRVSPGIDSSRVGVIGFSAGGHVAASLATRHGERVYSSVDEADDLSARPAFAALFYPVITMGEGAHAGSRQNLLGSAPPPALVARMSCERMVTAETPPVFLCLTAKDEIVSYRENGLAMFHALGAAGIAAELHFFQDGHHGFGARAVSGSTPSAWPELLLHWGYRNGWFRDTTAKPA